MNTKMTQCQTVYKHCHLNVDIWYWFIQPYLTA
jgi:hypothetical protein